MFCEQNTAFAAQKQRNAAHCACYWVLASLREAAGLRPAAFGLGLKRRESFAQTPLQGSALTFAICIDLKVILQYEIAHLILKFKKKQKQKLKEKAG